MDWVFRDYLIKKMKEKEMKEKEMSGCINVNQTVCICKCHQCMATDCICNSCQCCNLSLLSRVKKIEEKLKCTSNRMDKLQYEFDKKLDIDLEKWKEYYSKVFVNKKPYKCPICEGKGEYNTIKAIDEVYWIPCKSCEGKGIVWG